MFRVGRRRPETPASRGLQAICVFRALTDGQGPDDIADVLYEESILGIRGSFNVSAGRVLTQQSGRC